MSGTDGGLVVSLTRWGWAFVLPFACSAFGCASGLGSAVADFEAGRHAQAARRLRELESSVSTFDERERLRYALYCGLTQLALGDARAAERWLSRVKRAADRYPFSVPDAERSRLAVAWRSLGRMPGE